jgi:hypothetical protein
MNGGTGAGVIFGNVLTNVGNGSQPMFGGAGARTAGNQFIDFVGAT